MTRDTAVEYIKNTRILGFSDAEIRAELIKSGWQATEVDLAFGDMQPKPSESFAQKPQPPTVGKKQSLFSTQPTPAFQVKKAPESKHVEAPSSIPFAEEHKSLPEHHEDLLSAPAQKKSYDAIPPKLIPIIKKQEAAPPSSAPHLVSREHLMSAPKQSASPTAPSLPKVARPNMVTFGKKKKLFAAFSVAGALVASGASAGYWYYQSAVYPMRVVQDGLANLSTVKSFHYTAELDMRLAENSSVVLEPLLPPLAGALYGALETQKPSGTPPAYSLRIRADGAADYHTASNPKHQLSVSLDTQELFGKNFEFESRLSDGAYYFRFLRLPYFDSRSVATGTLPVFTTPDIEEKWVAFNPDSFEEDFATYAGRIAEIDPSIFPGTGSVARIAEGQVDGIHTLWNQGPAITWDDEVFGEEFKGEFTYRIKGSLSDNAMPGLTSGAVNVWVSEQKHEVVKITLQGLLDGSEFFGNIEFHDINAPVLIEQPKGARNLREMLDLLFMGSSSGAQ